MKNQNEIKDILIKLNQDDNTSISNAYKLLLNFMKSNILEFEYLITVSTIIINHIKKERNEIFIIKVLECSNFLIDFLPYPDDDDNDDQKKSIDNILNQLIECLLSEKLLGNTLYSFDNNTDLEKEILENVQNIISGIVKIFKFDIILSFLKQNCFNNNICNNNNNNNIILIENYLKIICYLIESSTIQVIELESLFNSFIKLLYDHDNDNKMNIASITSYSSSSSSSSPLYNLINLIINDIGIQFLNKIDYHLQPQHVKNILGDLIDQYKKQKQKQHEQQEHQHQHQHQQQYQQQQNHDYYYNEKDESLDDEMEINISNSSSNNNNNHSIVSNSSINKSHNTSASKLQQQQQQRQEQDDKFSKLSKKKQTGIQLDFSNLTESEFEIRINEIINILNGTESEWNIKLNSLLTFQSIIRAGACKFSNFTIVFNRLKELLAHQLLDKRSILMKEACTAVIALGDSLEHHFEPYFEKYFDTLLKCIAVTTKVVAESSDHCIKCIIKTTKSCKIIPRIFEAISTDKSPTIRSKCVEYLYLLLGDLSPLILEKHLDLIEKSIRLGCIDAQPTARSFARQAFFQYSSNWPLKSNQLLSSLDLIAQKNIQKESNNQNVSGNGSSSISNTPTPSITNKLPNYQSPFLPQPKNSNNSNNSNNITPTFQLGSKPPTTTSTTSMYKSTKKISAKQITKPTLVIITPPNHNHSVGNFNLNNKNITTSSTNHNNISIGSSSSSSNNSFDSIEIKKRPISNLFTEVSDSTTSRKRPMLSHPSDTSSSSTSTSSITQPKRILNQQQEKPLLAPKRVPIVQKSTSSASGLPLSSVTNTTTSSQATTTTTTTTTITTTKQPLKPISTNTTNNSLNTIKPSSSLKTTTSHPIKNYVKDISDQQSKLISITKNIN